MAESGPRPFGHESSGVDIRHILIVGAILAATVLIAVVALHFVLNERVMPRHAQIYARSAPIPPAPRLQPFPRSDLAAFRAQKQLMLSGYAWTDPSHGYARIPIERAMAIYIRQHAVPSAASASSTLGPLR